MQRYKASVKRSFWSNNNERSNYNPFRKLSRRTKDSYSEGNNTAQSQDDTPSAILKDTTPDDIPKSNGHLFEIRLHPSANGEPLDVRPVNGFPGVEKPVQSIDEEIASAPVDGFDQFPVPQPHQFLSRQWRRLSGKKATVQTGSSGSPTSQSSNTKKNPLVRKRRVVVVEYGNTDHLKEGEIAQC